MTHPAGALAAGPARDRYGRRAGGAQAGPARRARPSCRRRRWPPTAASCAARSPTRCSSICRRCPGRAGTAQGQGVRGAAGRRNCRLPCARASSRRRWPCCAIRRLRRCSGPRAAPRWRSSPTCRTREGRGPALRLAGKIDRLAREGDSVWIVDYKTNRPPPTDPARRCGGLPAATRRLPSGGAAHLSRHACQGCHSVDRWPANHGDFRRPCWTPGSSSSGSSRPLVLDA